MNMKTITTKVLLTLGLTFAALAGAQTPLAFQSVARAGDSMSLAANTTWTSFSERGFTGRLTGMTADAVTYTFSQGSDTLEVTVRQTNSGVLLITKDLNAVVLAGK